MSTARFFFSDHRRRETWYHSKTGAMEAAIPRFFFHLRGGPDGLSLDEDGLDFPDVETAYLEAYRAANDMSHELSAKGRSPGRYAFEIMNASGDLVIELPFLEVIDGRRRRPARLSEATTLARARADRMRHLTAEVAEQVKRAKESLRRSQNLLKSIGRDRSG